MPGGIAARFDHGEAVPRRNGDEGGLADLFRHTTFGAGPTPSEAPKAADSSHSTMVPSESLTAEYRCRSHGTALCALEYALTLIYPCAKCAAPRRTGSREVPEGGRLSDAASPGSSKVGPSHLTDGASLT